MIAEAPTVDNLFTESLLSNPYSYYQDALTKGPVVYIPETQTYVLIGFELVRAATADHETYSNDYGALLRSGGNIDPDVQAALAKGWPLIDSFNTDPPGHTRFRKLANRAFSLPEIKKLETGIRKRVAALMEGIAARTQCDFLADYCVTLPVTVIADILSVSDLPIETVKCWSDAFMDLLLGGIVTKERRLEAASQIVAFQHHIMDKIAQRRADPSIDDLIAKLVHAGDSPEEAFNDEELLAVIQSLMIAGNDTTTSTLAEGMLVLARSPKLWERFRTQPDSINDFVEELLRYALAAAGLPRVTTHDVEIGDVLIKKGSVVHLRRAAANRDPSQFADPDTFDLDRPNLRTHLAFGRGIHTCSGNMLARVEIAATFEAVVRRLDAVQLIDESALKIVPNIFARGLEKLPISYQSLPG